MQKKSVVIFGAAATGVATQRVLENDGLANIQVIAFIDDDRKKGSKNLNGAPIITFTAFKELVALNPVDGPPKAVDCGPEIAGVDVCVPEPKPYVDDCVPWLLVSSMSSSLPGISRPPSFLFFGFQLIRASLVEDSGPPAIPNSFNKLLFETF
jgi:hypothetical protein